MSKAMYKVRKKFRINLLCFGYTVGQIRVKMNDLVCVKDFEDHAYKLLPRNTLDYYRSGAGRQETLENNRKAFSK